MKTILVIEDEPTMRRNLTEMLEMENYRVLTAPNGVAGLDIARGEVPDLILCDVMMPKLDGHGVLTALRDNAQTTRIPFLFLTAKGERTDVRIGMDLGADDYLVKPVPRKELLSAILARLEHAERHRAEFRFDYDSPKPLESLGLTPREAEVLFWAAQGKTNAEIAIILAVVPSTAKTHLEHIYAKLQVDGRMNATLRALEVLSSHKS